MIWTSELEPVVVDDTTVPEAVARAAAAHPERTALIDGPSGAPVSYRELSGQIDGIAAALLADGTGPGDCVAVWAPNSPPVAAVVLAAISVGAAVTGVNPAWTDGEVATQLTDAGAAVLVTVPALADRAGALGRRVIVLGDASSPRPPAAPKGARPALDCDSVALLPYSSGTTGLPKGVMLSHRQLVTVCRQLAQALAVDDRDVTLAVAPWFHILGFTAALLAPLTCGATVVTMPAFDPASFLDLLERHGVTYLAGPPPLAGVLARHPDAAAHDLGRLDLIGIGGAPLPAAMHEALARRLPGCAIGQGWGLTETSGALCIPTRTAGSAPGTVGPLLPNTELRVVDPATGHELGPDADGELQVRGPQTMLGYRHRPAETAAMIAADGWVRTGDLGHVTAGGRIVVVDRLKELIKVDAFQVAPAEVEAVIVEHPAIVDAAVIGRADDRHGETPVAYVVTSAAVSADELADWVAPRLAPYKRPTAFHTVDELPRTPSGKLLRRELRDPVRRVT